MEDEVCTIEYNLEESGDVLIRIYTIDGTLVDDDETAGDHSVDWDGENDEGEVVAPGFSDTKKICVVK